MGKNAFTPLSPGLQRSGVLGVFVLLWTAVVMNAMLAVLFACDIRHEDVSRMQGGRHVTVCLIWRVTDWPSVAVSYLPGICLPVI
jgi:hypothetical protein